ncbi:mycofactocin biosynthesis FMN-dependent deaminase MftD [Leucobacter weissii]|uniref:Mycofactocin biosynthesis FMN-dependent deaminase MftD n=1 Tax=Leucobacter weissii TaxID=1983706 RepID=A0A939SBU4_9MICO|nr:pre-mycofactocin synthase MftD [Leucobacter weissii]MBO1901795.1 mycofactocin biosynthesis FMN-dependent deaminase MftD [Leucobacter weissii]
MTTRVPFKNLAEAERLAKRRLPKPVWLAIKAGNEQGLTPADNERAFTELGFSPTVFERPTSFDTSTSIMGTKVDIPVIVSPVGAQAIHPDGEVGAARAAARHGTAMGLSSWATDPLSELLKVNQDVFFQLYWVGSKADIEKRVVDAKEQGAKGLIVTLDWSHTPRRDWGVPPAPPSNMGLKTMMTFGPSALARPRWFSKFLVRGRIPDVKVPNLWGRDKRDIPTFGTAWGEFERTPAPTWDDIKWIRELWGGPFMVKGINTIRDARLAADLGADAISVSNHGGNNIDGSPSPLRYLPYIVEAVGDRIEVMADGGVRRGSDVVKMLALGAKAVFIGRAYLYGLAVSGEAGVHDVLDILRNGIRETLYGIGKSSIHELSRDDLMVLNGDFFVPPTQ